MGEVERSRELKLPTVAVPVRLALAGHSPAPVDVFVADTKRHGRSELLDDVATLLDQPAGFLPVQGGEGMRLLAKHAIAWIALARHDQVTDPELDEPSGVFTLYDRQHRVEIELLAGDKLTGTLLESSPASRPRVIDYLNRDGFVRLWTSDEHYLINKAHILCVRELAE